MATLTTDVPEQDITGGDYFVSTELNGGTADLEIKAKGDTAFKSFTANAMVDGTMVLISLPKGTIKMTSSGSPTVSIQKRA